MKKKAPDERKGGKLKKSLVSMIIPNWNGGEDILNCLQSIRNLDFPKDSLEIIVIDNNSADGSPAQIKERFPETKLVLLKENVGAPTACNVGISKASGGFLFKLDHDVILDPSCLKELLAVADSASEIGIVGAKIYFLDEPSKIWCAGGVINWKRGTTSSLGVFEEDQGQFNEIQEVDFVAGCGLLIKRETIEQIGLLDERFFIYWDETDWCIRAKNAGFRVLCVPQAKIWHKVSASMGTSSLASIYYMHRNHLLFLRNNLSFRKRIYPVMLSLFDLCRITTVLTIKHKYRERNVRLKAFFDYLRCHLGKRKIDNFK